MKKFGKTKWKQILSMLLILSMPLPANGMVVSAETNEVTSDEGSINETPENPKHHCSNGEYTEWGYVYFGSYPQTEITDSSTIASIESVLLTSGVSSTGDGVDAVVTEADGTKTKYRRLGKGDAGDNRFTNNEYRYFKYEPIRWKVLWNDGKTLFVVAQQALDYKVYHDTDEEITWENCSLRTWLNDLFYKSAFDEDERKAIVAQDVENKDNPNPDHAVDGGNDTRDRVYLLSAEEATDEFYGFCREVDDSQTREVKETDFSFVRGTNGMGKGSGCWRLRSPGIYKDYACYVDDYGEVGINGKKVSRKYESALCPALHIDISSRCWRMSDGEGNEITGGMPENPTHHCAWDDQTSWSYVNFGSYPQTETLDSAVICDLEAQAEASGVASESNPADIEITEADGTKTRYRRLITDDYGGNSPDEYHYYRYYKWEPIRWRVLSNDGEYLFVMADQALDCENGSYMEWEKSLLRTWLNDSFYTAAFDSEEQSAIAEWEVKSTDTLGGNDTRDKIYFLSIEEVTNEAYGFCSDEVVDSPSRQMGASDYSQEKGTYAFESDRYHCVWWLRSPGTLECAAGVIDTGCVLRGSGASSGNHMGVCPVLHISLKSDAWFMAGQDQENAEEEALMGLRAGKLKTEYVQGEEIKLDDLGVTAVYKKSAKVLSPEDYTVNTDGIDMDKPGNYTLQVSYAEGNAAVKAVVTIIVKEKAEEGKDDGNTGGDEGKDDGNTEEKENVLKELRVTKAKIEYTQGEKLNLDDLKVTAVYEKSTAELALNKCSVNTSGVDMDTPGSYKLEVSYTEGKTTVRAAVLIKVKKKDDDVSQKQVKVKKIIITAPSRKLASGKKIKLTAGILPKNASNKQLTWKVSNKKYAAVKQDGTITLKAAGVGKTVTVTASAKDGSKVRGTIKIKIMKGAVKSIRLKSPAKTLKAGRSMKLKAKVKVTAKSANKTLKWTCSDKQYATVSKRGKVTAKKAGKGKKVTITAASTDGSNKKARIKIRIK